MPFNPKLAKQLLSPWKLRLWMLRSVTMGLLTGMIIVELNEEECRVKLKDRWWIRNPFRSVYWAVMSMAAEMSTGALLYAYASEPKVQFILVEMRAKFYKKVRGKSSIFAVQGRQFKKNWQNCKTLMTPEWLFYRL
jgi:hypothetical protein